MKKQTKLYDADNPESVAEFWGGAVITKKSIIIGATQKPVAVDDPVIPQPQPEKRQRAKDKKPKPR